MPKIVNRKFLTNLANEIYDTKTRKFLRLCDGTLQNGPDPTDAKRPMHCGLGELYFAMTGVQPEVDGVDEDDVVDTAVKLSTLPDEKTVRKMKEREAKRKKQEAQQKTKCAISVIKALRLPPALQDSLVSEVKNFDQEDDEDCEEESVTKRFRDVLDDIPGQNDDHCGDSCSFDAFRKRSMRVAAKLREAAALLPA